MSNVTAALPRKSLTAVERKFLSVGNRMLLDLPNGRLASAALMDIVTDWHAARANMRVGREAGMSERKAREIIKAGVAWIDCALEEIREAA